MMDLTRCKKIEGIQAIKLLLEEERLLSEEGVEFRIDPTFSKLYHAPWAHEVLSDLSFNEIVSRNWYVKKPFDVRAEMFSRPDEWVGAFKDELGYWHKVGLLTGRMVAKEMAILNKDATPLDHHNSCSPHEIDCCIPIEDVPKEDLQ